MVLPPFACVAFIAFRTLHNQTGSSSLNGNRKADYARMKSSAWKSEICRSWNKIVPVSI